MDMEELEARINSANDEMIVEEDVEEVPELPRPTDMWQSRRNAQAQIVAPTIRGARPKMQLDMQQLLEGGIQDAYKKALDGSELRRAEGDLQTAQLIEQQYMQDYFYPTVDALIRLNSRDEVLANQEALATLDALAITPGGGRSDGYTSMFISSLYEPTDNTYHTDAWVTEQLRRIAFLSGDGRLREASAIAKKLQQAIDAGEHSATPEDYETIQRVAIRI